MKLSVALDVIGGPNGGPRSAEALAEAQGEGPVEGLLLGHATKIEVFVL